MSGDNKFELTSKDLESLTTDYLRARLTEVHQTLQTQIGGTQKLLRKLGTDSEIGLTGDDFELRYSHFQAASEGSNGDEQKEESLLGRISSISYLIVLSLGCSQLLYQRLQDEYLQCTWTELCILIMAALHSVWSWITYPISSNLPHPLYPVFDEGATFIVKRNNKEEKVKIGELKVGDIIKLEPQTQVLFDAILIEGSNISVSESKLTGTSEPIRKGTIEDLEKYNGYDQCSSVLLAGSSINEGQGWCVAIAVGHNTRYVQVRKKINEEKEPSQLQVGLNKLKPLYQFLSLLYICVNLVTLNNDFVSTSVIFITMNSLALPHYFEIISLLCLSNATQGMVRDGIMVRKIEAVENLAYVDCVVCDKTNVLTKGEMSVTHIWQGKNLSVSSKEESKEALENLLPGNTELLIQACACNIHEVSDQRTSTEKAICSLLTRYKINVDHYRHFHLPKNHAVFEFTSKRKKRSTICQNVKDTQFGYPQRLHTLGAPEIILSGCNRYINEDGEEVDLSDDVRNMITEECIEYHCMRSRRLLCLAYKDIKEGECGPEHQEDAKDGFNKAIEVTGDMTCICFLAIQDTLRPGVTESIQALKDAGIRVAMATGDNKLAARSLGVDANIHTQAEAEESVLLATDFIEKAKGLICTACENEFPCTCEPGKWKISAKDSEAFSKVLDISTAIARARPEDKVIYTSMFKQRGYTVAMVGDGTNDAPACQDADVGFAIGPVSTEITKDASDVVTLTEDFYSVVRALKWGRHFYSSIQKVLKLVMVTNLISYAYLAIGPLFSYKVELTAIHLIWLNAVVALGGTAVLCFESPPSQLKKVTKHGREMSVVSSEVLKHIAICTLLDLCLASTLFASLSMNLESYQIDWTAYTISTLIVLHIVNVFIITSSSPSALMTLFNIGVILSYFAVIKDWSFFYKSTEEAFSSQAIVSITTAGILSLVLKSIFMLLPDTLFNKIAAPSLIKTKPKIIKEKLD